MNWVIDDANCPSAYYLRSAQCTVNPHQSRSTVGRVVDGSIGACFRPLAVASPPSGIATSARLTDYSSNSICLICDGFAVYTSRTKSTINKSATNPQHLDSRHVEMLHNKSKQCSLDLDLFWTCCMRCSQSQNRSH